MNLKIKSIAISAVISTMATCSAFAGDPLALKILKNLDITSFSNSFWLKHLPKGTRLKDTDFNNFHINPPSSAGIYYAIDKDENFEYSVWIMSKNSRGVIICFGDFALKGTAKTLTPLLVEKNKKGAYVAKKEVDMGDECLSTH
ncbi:hypothetical protein GNF76_29180 [Pseudomonas sp. CCM 7893]|uniref:Pesticin immunity protein n=1 Tax=Pseudomonas spelaei TaxID=1055469 RepID=A0A6I3WJL2_9PSED|nr:hypothetical protein [Pseudomonas spelaei]MUF08401.1 hypothetical protein [Pseudomonas spelaei]